MQATTVTQSKIEQGLALPLMEMFDTIQGEGLYSGKAAFFIRIAGCAVGCVWCDVKESWQAGDHPVIGIDKIVEKARKSKAQFCVITGGEPAMYDLSHLTEKLKKYGFGTHIETSGAYTLTGNFDWITLSPKKFKVPLESEIIRADELKIIVYNKSDLKWAEEYKQKVRPDCQLFLQPEWSVRKKVMPLIVDYVKIHPQWQISLQTHKYLGVE